MTVVHPYNTLSKVSLNVTGVDLDNHPLPLTMVSTGDEVVALHSVDHTDWSEAYLEVAVTLPEHELTAAKDEFDDLRCHVVLAENITNTRRTATLRAESPARWRGGIALPRQLFRRRAGLHAVVTATVDKVAGRIVGESTTWNVDLFARAPSQSYEPEIVEVDFRSSEALRPVRDALWYVDATGDDNPVIHINTGVEGLTALLAGEGGPAARGLHIALTGQIATEAWVTMFHAALDRVEVGPDDSVLWPDGWRERVLRVMLPDVLPDLAPDDALHVCVRRRTEGDNTGELSARLQYAAGRRARTSRRLAAPIRTARRPVEEGRS